MLFLLNIFEEHVLVQKLFFFLTSTPFLYREGLQGSDFLLAKETILSETINALFFVRCLPKIFQRSGPILKLNPRISRMKLPSRQNGGFSP